MASKASSSRTYSKAPLFTKSTKLDTFYFVYLVLHVFITVLVDSSLAIPKQFQPAFQRTIIDFHISSNKDFLLVSPPQWLVFFGWIELLIQLPFFVVGAVALYKRSIKIYPYLVAYGLEASATTLLCIIEIKAHGPSNGLTDLEIWNLIAVYLPTFIIPLFLAIDIISRSWKEDGSKKTQ